MIGAGVIGGAVGSIVSQGGAVGLDAQQKALDTIANNISNVNTAGFKRTEVRFTEMLASQLG